MSTRFNVVKAQERGVINLFELGGAGQYLLVVLGKTKDYVIPFLHTEEDGDVAYLPDSISIQEEKSLKDLVDAIYDTRLFPLSKFYPVKTTAVPEHSKDIVKIVQGQATVKGQKAEQVAKDAGYNIPETTFVSTSLQRDYTSLKQKDKEALERYEDAHAELEASGATFEGLSPEIRIAYQGVATGRSLGIIFAGPTGTGKSWAAKILADKAGAPLLTKEITYGTSSEDLVGSYVPSTSKDGAKWVFVPGPLLRAYTEGWQIALEEINYGQPGVNATLNEFLDGTERVIVNGVSYKKHPNFVCYMTMNPGYQGTEPLNTALKNRFSIVDVPELSKKEYVKRCGAYSQKLGHRLSDAFFEKLYDFAHTIEKEATQSAWHEDVKFSIRNAQRLCNTILASACSKDDFKHALFVEFVNALSCDNDNSTKLQDYKKNSIIIDSVNDIYKTYDFAEQKETTDYVDLNDLYTEEETATSSSSATSKRNKVLDSLKEEFE